MTNQIGYGKLIVIEGLDGVGKTSACIELHQQLDKKGIPARYFRAPGGSELAESVREVLLEREEALPQSAELHLFLASMIITIDEMIIPALKEGNVVICDRLFWSTYAYQIHGRKDEHYWGKHVMGLFQRLFNNYPTYSIKLTVDEETRQLRIGDREDGNVKDNQIQSEMERIIDGYSSGPFYRIAKEISCPTVKSAVDYIINYTSLV